MQESLEIISWICAFAFVIWLSHLAWSTFGKYLRHQQLMEREAVKIQLLKQLAQNAGLPDALTDVATTGHPKLADWIRAFKIIAIVISALATLFILYTLYVLFLM